MTKKSNEEINEGPELSSEEKVYFDDMTKRAQGLRERVEAEEKLTKNLTVNEGN